jgi:hypothetical protein
MHHFGGVFTQAKFAIEVPKIGAFGQVTAAFAFEIFANLVLNSVEQAVGVFAFDLELECFFHESPCGEMRPKRTRESVVTTGAVTAMVKAIRASS